MFIVFIYKLSLYQYLIKMLRRAYCHCDHNTKDCSHTAEDVTF